MAFSNDRWRLFRDVGPWRAWYYEASGDTVTATGYFNEKWQDLRVNDVIYVETAADVPQYRVSAIAPNSVTVTSYGSGGGGGGLSDGDYGDVTVSSSGTAMTVDAAPLAGITGLGSGVATFLGTPTSANLAAAVTNETGSGSLVFATSPTLTTPALGTPSALVLTNATGLPVAGGGTGLATATAYAVLCGGTTGTGALQSIAGVGTSGQVLTSNGAGALPTFQNASGGSADDWDIVSTSNPSSPYTASTLTGNTIVKITALAGNLTINKPTGTFGSSKRFFVQYVVTASGADRTLTWGSGITLGQGVAPLLVVASGTTSIYTLYTDDNGSNFNYDGDADLSKLGTATETSGDYYLGYDASASNIQVRFPVVLAASETVVGKVELATAAEVNTGTDTGRAIHPDGLAASYAGTKAVSLPITALVGDDHATGDGQAWFVVPACLNGMNLVGVVATVATAGTTGTADFQLRRVRSGSAVDMLSTKITIDSTETSTTTAATPAVINTSNDDVATGDIIYLDVDAVQTTKAKGGAVGLEFRLP